MNFSKTQFPEIFTITLTWASPCTNTILGFKRKLKANWLCSSQMVMWQRNQNWARKLWTLAAIISFFLFSYSTSIYFLSSSFERILSGCGYSVHSFVCYFNNFFSEICQFYSLDSISSSFYTILVKKRKCIECFLRRKSEASKSFIANTFVIVFCFILSHFWMKWNLVHRLFAIFPPNSRFEYIYGIQSYVLLFWRKK